MLRFAVIGVVILTAATLIIVTTYKKDAVAGWTGQANDKDAEIDRLHKEVDELRLELRKMSSVITTAAARTKNQTKVIARIDNNGEDAAGNDDSEAARRANDPAYLAEEQRKIAQWFERLDEQHFEESRDGEWADEAEKELSSIVNQLAESGLSGAAIINNECKSTVCKLEVTYDDPQTQQDFARQIRSPFFSGGTIDVKEENGELKSIAYYSRQGHELTQY